MTMQAYKSSQIQLNPIELIYRMGEAVDQAKEKDNVDAGLESSWQGIAFSLCGKKMIVGLSEAN